MLLRSHCVIPSCDVQAGLSLRIKEEVQGQEGGFAVVRETVVISSVCLSVSLQDSDSSVCPTHFTIF